jgi:hypothetical protein
VGRQSDRYRVHLRVSYQSAADFVREFAENLSAGGMFIAGATGLAPLEQVGIEVELPGFGNYRVKAEVAHVLDETTAERLGRTAGAGVAIIDAPPDWQEALSGYLQRLGSRADRLVLVSDPELRLALAATGYQTGAAPAPGGLVAAVARSEIQVHAVVVRSAEVDAYRAEAAKAGDPDLVHAAGGPADLDLLLAALDSLL